MELVIQRQLSDSQAHALAVPEAQDRHLLSSPPSYVVLGNPEIGLPCGSVRLACNEQGSNQVRSSSATMRDLCGLPSSAICARGIASSGQHQLSAGIGHTSHELVSWWPWKLWSSLNPWIHSQG